MIFYQYDPDMDHEFVSNLIDRGLIKIPETSSMKGNRIQVTDKDEIFLFSNDHEEVGLIWLVIQDRHSMDVHGLYMDERIDSDRLKGKFMSFAVKRARYLNLDTVRFHMDQAIEEGTQVADGLGCVKIQLEGQTVHCTL
ncbi:hypothetical protein [Pseudalkalibacillus sp. SCS-8]|uniref:hypothetical protein n=1 Tax=Pseudalkalibacillus nanhaiensis TaxID=3115291 RepID=UPI0032D9B979